MKRLICFALIIVALIIATPTFVCADVKADREQTEEKIAEKVKTIENVSDCRVMIIAGNALIAVRTKGIVSGSAAKKMESAVKEKVAELCPECNVYVNTSVKAFKAIESFEKGERLRELFELFNVKFPEHRPHDKPCPLPHDNNNTSPQTSQTSVG